MWNPVNPLGDEALHLIRRDDFDLKVQMPDTASLAREVRFYM